MAYVRAKTGRSGRISYQLVEAYREDGKPRQRVLLHLGECLTLDEVLSSDAVDRLERDLAKATAERDRLEATILRTKWLEPWHKGGPIPEKWNWFKGTRAPRFVASYFHYRRRVPICEMHLLRARTWMAKAQALKDAGVSVTVSPELRAERDRYMAELDARIAELDAELFE